MKEQTRPRKALILGGGYAGMIAAARIARGVRRAAVDVTLLDSKADFVQRIRLHEVLAGREPTASGSTWTMTWRCSRWGAPPRPANRESRSMRSGWTIRARCARLMERWSGWRPPPDRSSSPVAG